MTTRLDSDASDRQSPAQASNSTRGWHDCKEDHDTSALRNKKPFTWIRIRPGFHFRQVDHLVIRKLRPGLLKKLREELELIHNMSACREFTEDEGKEFIPVIAPFFRRLGIPLPPAFSPSAEGSPTECEDLKDHGDHEAITETVDEILEEKYKDDKDYLVVDGGFIEEGCVECGTGKWCGSKSLEPRLMSTGEAMMLRIPVDHTVKKTGQQQMPVPVTVRVPIRIFVEWTIDLKHHIFTPV